MAKKIIKKEKDFRKNCDNFTDCKNKAEYNLNLVYKLFECQKDGGYEEIKEWDEGSENAHLCEACAEDEGII